MKLVYQVNDRPKFTQLVVFGFQQVLAIMAATIAVPLIIGNGMSTAAALYKFGCLAYYLACVEAVFAYEVVAYHYAQGWFILKDTANCAEHVARHSGAQFEHEVFGCVLFHRKYGCD